MQFDELLNKDDRYMYLILKYIELNPDRYITVPGICEIMGLSVFKVRHYIDNINRDFVQESSKSKVKLGENNEVTFENIDMLVVKKMRLLFLKRSEQFNLLQDVFIEGTSVEEHRQKRYISKTKVYDIKKELTTFLSKFDLTYKKNILEGEELAVRTLFFGIYYEFFNGLKLSFPNDTSVLANNLIQMLISQYELVIPDSKMAKLTIFLNVLLVRLKQGAAIGPLQELVFFDSKAEESDDVFIVFKKNLALPPETLSAEWSYVLCFLFGEGLINKEQLPFTSVHIKTATELSSESVRLILENLDMKQQMNSEAYDKNYRLLVSHFERIHLNRELFYASKETFYLPSQFTYFSENYPVLSDTVMTEINRLIHLGNVTSTQKNKLYYDYLFAVLKVIDLKLLEPIIYICVDFSHGSNYTEYISNELLGFKNLNICLQTKITSETHVYVSDIAVDRKLKAQIIWKNPPTSNDWELFGNTMIQLKNDYEVRENV